MKVIFENFSHNTCNSARMLSTMNRNRYVMAGLRLRIMRNVVLGIELVQKRGKATVNVIIIGVEKLM